MLERGVPLRGSGEVQHEGKTFIAVEILLAPLGHTGDEAGMIYFLTKFDMPSPSA